MDRIQLEERDITIIFTEAKINAGNALNFYNNVLLNVFF